MRWHCSRVEKRNHVKGMTSKTTLQCREFSRSLYPPLPPPLSPPPSIPFCGGSDRDNPTMEARRELVEKREEEEHSTNFSLSLSFLLFSPSSVRWTKGLKLDCIIYKICFSSPSPCWIRWAFRAGRALLCGKVLEVVDHSFRNLWENIWVSSSSADPPEKTHGNY